MAKQWQHSEQCLPLQPYSVSFILMAFCPPSAAFQQWLSHPCISRTLECKWPYIGSRNLMHWSICNLRVRLQTSMNVTPHVYAFWLTEARTVTISLARAKSLLQHWASWIQEIRLADDHFSLHVWIAYLNSSHKMLCKFYARLINMSVCTWVSRSWMCSNQHN